MGELKIPLKVSVRDLPDRGEVKECIPSSAIIVKADATGADSKGQRSGTIEQRRYGQLLAGEYATNSSIVGTETVTAHGTTLTGRQKRSMIPNSAPLSMQRADGRYVLTLITQRKELSYATLQRVCSKRYGCPNVQPNSNKR